MRVVKTPNISGIWNLLMKSYKAVQAAEMMRTQGAQETQGPETSAISTKDHGFGYTTPGC